MAIFAALQRLRMNNDVLWLVRLGIDQGLVTRAQCTAVRRTLGEGAELVDFAQKLIDDGVVEDVALVEKLGGLAYAKGQKGPPANDPFDD